MAIPGFQDMMLPLLQFASDGAEKNIRTAIDALALQVGLTPAEREEYLPSGTQRTFDNRTHWARKYLLEAKLIEATRRAHFRITERGKTVLKENPASIDIRFLQQFAGFDDFRTRDKPDETTIAESPLSENETPDEQISGAHALLNRELSKDLLERVKGATPDFFEQLVVDLLVKMGYGGSDGSEARKTRRTNDEGIDGIVNQDPLGLDVIYVQAKRYTTEGTAVGRPELQKFVGALQGQRARRGVFFTTARFSQEAIDYATSVDMRIILVDGQRLSGLMIEYGLGVSQDKVYVTHKIDTDFFEEA